jgi:DNA polymerase III epsilon subunit-like protein
MTPDIRFIGDILKRGGRANKMSDSGLIVLDIETTGLQCRPRGTDAFQKDGAAFDEILQLAIVDDAGDSLFYESFKPRYKKSWKPAQKIHGIMSSDVKDKAHFEDRRGEIQNIINTSTLIVAYNAEFDLGFLSAQEIELDKRRYVCLMKEFARVYGAKRKYGGGYIWQSLDTCAQYYGVSNPHMHNALSDTETTLLCYQAFIKEDKFTPHKEVWTNARTNARR